jgi:hypothetical protein
MRFTFFWTHCFSAAVILSAIVIREPESSFTDMALLELGWSWYLHMNIYSLSPR